MQGNTNRINDNHWMEVNTNGGMDELVTWIKRPTFSMKKRPNTLGELHHTIHHTMVVDPMPGERIPGQPASPRPAGLTSRPIGPSQVGGCFNRRCKKQYRAFDQNSANPRLRRPAGLTFPRHVLNFCVRAKQPTYLRKVHALASAPPWKSYKRTPTPPFQDTENWSKSKVKFSVPHSFRK